MKHKEVKKTGSFTLKSKFGNFTLTGYEIDNNTKERFALAIVKGKVKNKEDVYVRIHSQCIFAEVFGSYLCDCKEQLDKSLELIAKNGGVLIYLDQDGRGHGLLTKIKEYSMQENGYDTYEASIKVGVLPDNRTYKYGIQILESLGVKGVKLITNNPEKINAIQLSNLKFSGRIPVETKPNKHNIHYLKTKKKKFAHLLDHL